MHDYFSGMICLRDGGSQMPDMIKKYTNKGVYWIYNVFVCVLLLLVGAVFIYTPGDIAAKQVFGFSGEATAVSTWVIYGVIFVYYLVATLFPIDVLIARIYHEFSGLLLFSAVGVFIGIFAKGYPLVELWNSTWTYGGVNYSQYFADGHFLPVFFVTVACGILSGFHSTQTAIISRTMKSERQGRNTFYNMMVLEGFIAMVWAAGAMGVYNLGLQEANAQLATSTVGIVCKDILGNVGGIIALLGVIVLPITSGDTALRALRLTVSDTLHIDQSTNGKRLGLSATLIGLMVAVGILRASGFLDFLSEIIGKMTAYVGFPSQLVPLAIVRMFSSSAATGLVLDIFKEYGTDSRIGLIASIMMSCTETIFYTMSVYFMAAKVRKTRYTLAGALAATLAGIMASVWLATN